MRLRIVFTLGCVLAFVVAVAACGWDWTVVPKATTGDCKASSDCSPDQFCVYPDERCGTGKPGVCKPKDCEALPGLACGCDGHVYANNCEAYTAGVDLSSTACAPPSSDVVECGAYFCPATSFCLSDVEQRCMDWECSDRTCACAIGESKCPKAACEQDAGGTFVTCK